MTLFNDLLQVHGYNTVQTKDGREAVSLIEEHRPDLIIMDIHLPMISGLDITKQIKQMDDLKNIPVIAVTAFAMKGDEKMIMESGCDGYISKPISIPVFLETIAGFLK